MQHRVGITSKCLGLFFLFFLALSLLFAPGKAAFAEPGGEAVEKVGNLAIVATFDPATDNINGGHSYLVFTSYQDNLTLGFQNLYGYYQVDEQFFKAAQENEQLWAQPKSLSLADGAYALTLGSRNPADAENRFRTTAYNCTLDKNEFITIGDYSMVADELGLSDDDALSKMIQDSFQYSSLKDEFLGVIRTHLRPGMTEESFVNGLLDCLAQYFADAQPSPEGLQVAVMGYLVLSLGPQGAQAAAAYLTNPELYDGDTMGGVFVCREMWRQKNWQNLYPNAVYSIDVTQDQLDSLIGFLNGPENHYAALGHNCSSVSSGAWNAAVGFVRDASGNNTADRSPLYIDAKDSTYAALSGMFDTPKKVYETIQTWDDALGGTKAQWPIVHGVKAPEPAPGPDSQPDPQIDPEPVPNPNPEPIPEASSSETVSKANAGASGKRSPLPAAGDSLPVAGLALAALVSGAVLGVSLRRQRGR